ncbi:g6772 [Coccomyxa elongata]
MLVRALGDNAATFLIIATSLLLRFGVGLHPYSGAGSPPRYGDYEAQRHWMEVTVHVPIQDWYTSTTDNDLDYWGLDYPPISAYQSWVYGKAIQQFEPGAIASFTSRGYETPSSKTLMRWSVVISDILVFIPAVLACRWVFFKDATAEQRAWVLFAALLQPAAVLIDHGHFQYNNISLGFAAGAAAAVASGKEVLGSILFCLSLNHKQMSMYYAPAFFAHLLGRCLARPTLLSKVGAVLRLGFVVIGTFACIWAPFLLSESGALGVVARLAPLRRGLFEDYVANFWCSTSPLVKWKQLFSQQELVRMCAGATLFTALPAMLQQIRRPSKKGLLLCMASSAFAFFLFSYQVHEKSILLPLLPVTLLAPDLPVLASWMPAVATFSMYPLLKKDGLSLAYVGLLLFWAAFTLPDRAAPKERTRRPGRRNCLEDLIADVLPVLFRTFVGLALGIHAAAAVLNPPKRLPYIFDAVITVLSFLQFAGAAMHIQLLLWKQDHEKVH